MTPSSERLLIAARLFRGTHDRAVPAIRRPLLHWPHLDGVARMPVVELDRISKAYDKKIAVQDLSLRIEPGSMFGLLGPNGAGKTSSIRMMIGVTLPDSGTVAL